LVNFGAYNGILRIKPNNQYFYCHLRAHPKWAAVLEKSEQHALQQQAIYHQLTRENPDIKGLLQKL
jgi:hypothetical protein